MLPRPRHYLLLFLIGMLRFCMPLGYTNAHNFMIENLNQIYLAELRIVDMKHKWTT